ncbi:MAG: lipoyl(octanoyl) transferase LipB, partial [Rhodospirillales bacterium]|nr:lipoyl(octanoyl) transferase LipB [Rhodospirillales bacterium]
RYTYHGPGQRVVYLMLDLKQRGADVRGYVRNLENWVINTLDQIGINGERRDGRVGIWVGGSDGREEKIAAIGVRIRRWVSFHGIAINLDPDLAHFEGIVPCGIAEYGVTSIRQQGINMTMSELDQILRQTFGTVFDVGPADK